MATPKSRDENLKRVTIVYLPEEHYRQMQSKLKLESSNFSAWVREKVEEELKNSVD